ncbi:acyl-CoA thioesterase [Ornithinibacillus massiliensis]|uniref:Acyl-CoA thioesterase n=1 Tax=Ornithinibacillus massiliensis TaxID=1944633 RepID=A0ABS5MAR4_9BACI|nr:thioesterase family protein [Ornithinibacillus massiliensis]MBS3679409.1 acyl-CoA thioesterase [Ornithinibacillus massiliensis]
MGKISYIEDFEAWKAEFFFSIPIRIRFSETDMFGHVNNVSPFIYFEEARIEYLKSVGLFDNASSTEGIPIVADLQCDYHKQLYFQDSLRIYVKAAHVGTTSFDIHYMGVNQKEEVCLTGRGRIVYINPESGRPIKLGEEIKDKLMMVTNEHIKPTS